MFCQTLSLVLIHYYALPSVGCAPIYAHLALRPPVWACNLLFFFSVFFVCVPVFYVCSVVSVNFLLCSMGQVA